MRQDDASEPDRRSRPRHRRRSGDSRQVHKGLFREGLGRVPQPHHRLCVSELQPDSASDGAGQRRAGADADGRFPRRAPGARRGSAEARGSGRPASQEAVADVRRADAARGDCARADQQPGRAAGRRAHRRAGQRNQRSGDGAFKGNRPRPAGDHGYAQP